MSEAKQRLAEAERARLKGDERAAHEAYRSAASGAHDVDDLHTEAQALFGLGETCLALDDEGGAARAFGEAAARAMEAGDALLEAEARFALATVAFDAGQSKDGHDELIEAMALYREESEARPDEVHIKRRLARAVRVYGEHLGVLGSEQDARQALELAKRLFVESGDEALARGIDEELRRLGDWAR